MQQESLYLTDQHHQLHIRHIYQKLGGKPVLMLHGTIENGRIFYTDSGKGLACYLAEQGFDVYVADFRGKGKSQPSIAADADHGQYEMITRDIPAFIDFVTEKAGQKMQVVCHSWGGVLLKSTLARFPKYCQRIDKVVCFGTKRTIFHRSFAKLLKVDLFWNRLAPMLAKRRGYIDAKKMNFGADNETHQFLSQCVPWVKPGNWQDPVDDFNYAAQAQQLAWPAIWHVTGINDLYLGHINDVRAFVTESNAQAKISLLSKANGNLCDYDHIDILTSPLAVDDHFPEIAQWLSGN